MINIRSAEVQDAEVIADYNVRLALETEDTQLDGDTILRGVTQLIQEPEHGFYLVAEHDARVIATLMITFEFSDWRHGQFWWIQSVYVLDDYRRQGVFRQLFQHVQQIAESRSDVCGFRLYVENDNERAQQTYANMGLGATSYLVYEKEFPGRGLGRHGPD